MIDIVDYKIPFGFLEDFTPLLVFPKLRKFLITEKALVEIFDHTLNDKR